MGTYRAIGRIGGMAEGNRGLLLFLFLKCPANPETKQKQIKQASLSVQL